MSAYTQAEKNIRKTWALMGGFLVFVIFIGWGASYFFNSPIILYGATAFALFGNFFSYFFSDKVALSMSGAKPADPKNPEDKALIRLVENLSIASGLPTPKIYIIEDQSMNAFATGRDPKHASVAFTRGIIKALDKTELEGVAAHELSHIKNRDILVMTVVVTLVGILSVLMDMAMRGMLFGGGRDNKGNGALMIVGIVLMILAPIVGKIIQLAISRKREYLADASGALMTRYPEGLASALEKIGSQSPPMKRASHATSHLFIANPFGAKEDSKGKKALSFMEKWFSTHPPIQERVKALRQMDVNVS